MAPPSDQPAGVPPEASTHSCLTLVEVPVLDASPGVLSLSSGEGQTKAGNGLVGRGRGKAQLMNTGGRVGIGGPIRREKVKRAGVLDRGGAQGKEKKRTVGGAESAGEVSVGRAGEEGLVGGAEGSNPKTEGSRGGRGRAKKNSGSREVGRGAGSPPSCPSGDKGEGAGKGKAVEGGSRDPTSPGGRRGGATGVRRVGEQGLGAGDSAESPSSGAPSRSPGSRPRGSPRGKSSPQGRKNGKEPVTSQGHGVLVRRIKEALLASVEGEVESGSGSKEGGEPSY